jgi:hypothetical protein
MSLATLAIVQPATTSPSPVAAPGGANDAAKPAAPVHSGFEILTRYIPTETVTLYVAAMAGREQIALAFGIDQKSAITVIYTTFALLTPVVLIVLMLVAHRQSGTAEPFKLRLWPLFAALVGYLVWALSVPGHPVADQLAGLPALGALVVSTFLSLLDPLFAPKPKS